MTARPSGRIIRRSSLATPRRDRALRSFKPQYGDRDLAPHPHRLELVAAPRGLVFPQLCPACGATAVGWLPVRKVFVRSHSDGPQTYLIERVSAPFCGPCIERHRAEDERQTLAQQLRRALFSESSIAMVCAGATGLFFLTESVGQAVGGSGTGAVLTGAMATFCLLIAAGSAHAAWSNTARDRVPPQTSVTRAFDYSDDTSELFDPPRHAYAIQDGAFAEAFAALNRDAVWDPGAPRALEAERKRWVAMVVVAALAVIGVVWEWWTG